MTECAAVGSFSILLVEPKAAATDPDPTFDGSSERYPFLYETFKAKRPVRPSRMIYGNRSRWSNRVVKRSYVPKGAIGFQLGPREYDLWLPRILGTPESTNVFALSEAAPPLFDCMFLRGENVFYGRNCQVAAAVFHAKASDGEDEDEILNLQISIIAREIDLDKTWPVAVPAVTEGEDYIPYIFSQGLLEYDNVEYDFNEFRLMIDNGLRPRTRNSLTPNCIYAGQRTIRLEVENPFTADIWAEAQLLYETGAGTPGMVRFETGTGPSDEALQFDFPALRAHLEEGTTTSHEEIPLSISMEALRTVASLEMVTTNIS